MTIAFIILLIGACALREWVKGRSPSKNNHHLIQKRVSQLIALGEWQAADRELSVITGYGDGITRNLSIQILRGTKQWERLDPLLDRALRDDGENLFLLSEKGKSLLERGFSQEALPLLERAKPVLINEDSIVDLATAYFQNQLVDKAWEILEDRALESSNGRLLALAGDCQYYWGKYSVAISFYQQAQYYLWRNKRTLSRMAHCFRCTGKTTEAERYYRAILDYDSADSEATLGLGACFESRGLYQRALLVYQGGDAWDKGDPRLIRQAGIAAVYTGKHRFGEVYLREAIQRGSETPEAIALLGYSLECQKRWNEAEDWYFRLLETYPEHVAGYRALAWLYGVGLSQSIDAQQGLAMARQAVELLPDAASWELLSACEARAGNFLAAHDIQEKLSNSSEDKETRQRCRVAMRQLRKKAPLQEQHVSRVLVA